VDARTKKNVLVRYRLIARLVLEILPSGDLREIVRRYYGITCSKRAVGLREYAAGVPRCRNAHFQALVLEPRQERCQSAASRR
jgi:hypothetical protein